MLRSTFPRFFGPEREGAMIRGVWAVGATGAVTKLRGHPDLVLTRDGAGDYTATLTNGARVFDFISGWVSNVDTDDTTDIAIPVVDEERGGQNETGGTVKLTMANVEAADPGVDPSEGAEIHLFFFAAK